jgi:hypothetical protein|tara:strand:- start:287 stop:460 length:174 start_codon:yes stop_codon:yes gene_type:complete
MNIERLADPFEEQSARQLRNKSRHITMNSPKGEPPGSSFYASEKSWHKTLFFNQVRN